MSKELRLFIFLLGVGICGEAFVMHLEFGWDEITIGFGFSGIIVLLCLLFAYFVEGNKTRFTDP